MSEQFDSEIGRYWEEHYRSRERLWSGRPNPLLVEVAAPLGPGRVLDLGCGEGGDAVWLARSGWQVTAVDVSATALERARAHAVEAGAADRIDFQRHDLGRTLPEGSFDLVSAQYLQSQVEFPRDRVLHSAAELVADDGLLLVVDHAAAPPWSGHFHEHVFPTARETLTEIGLAPDDWHLERLATPEREAVGPDGQPGTLADNVILLRRLAR
ncbi:class I SAM-dependent methyltransferase [Kitasatospora sp. HPMI-4]|uniref:class I SAM-dependent methyltransferase n=1 Tax=Kitasatospora sp. HPMI-4 TaxID=3448443 RepID=UPI003F1E3EAD